MSLPIARYALDHPRGSGPFRFAVGADVPVVGWALHESRDADPPAVVLEVMDPRTGTAIEVPTIRAVRSDVVSHFGQRALMSGFEARFRLDSHARGTRLVRMRCDDAPPIDLFTIEVTGSPYESDIREQLAARFLDGDGLEVGALQRRLSVPAHCSVKYVDRMGLADLLAHYPELIGQPIQEPDIIDDGETLAKVGSETQQFVVANHFLEHCENPIQTIMNLARVLRPGGILFMAVPDQRFTFDLTRPITGYESLAETFRTGLRRDRAEMYAEWAVHVLATPASDVHSVANKLLHEHYSIHFNVWALPDLVSFLARSRDEFDLPVTLEWVVSSDNEVILILRKVAGDRAAVPPIEGMRRGV